MSIKKEITMKQEEIQMLLKKVEELKALFVFSQRTIPFLDDIFYFVKEIVPVLLEMRYSIMETSDKLPKASKHLDKVTHATEMATSEILNILETTFTKIQDLQNELKENTNTIPDYGKHINSVLESIKNDNMNIMMALQVQDITSQQIAAVHKLMLVVDTGLSRLMKHYGYIQITSKDEQYNLQHVDISFDESAEYFGSQQSQPIADKVIEKIKKIHKAKVSDNV